MIRMSATFPACENSLKMSFNGAAQFHASTIDRLQRDLLQMAENYDGVSAKVAQCNESKKFRKIRNIMKAIAEGGASVLDSFLPDLLITGTTNLSKF